MTTRTEQGDLQSSLYDAVDVDSNYLKDVDWQQLVIVWVSYVSDTDWTNEI